MQFIYTENNSQCLPAACLPQRESRRHADRQQITIVKINGVSLETCGVSTRGTARNTKAALKGRNVQHTQSRINHSDNLLSSAV